MTLTNLMTVKTKTVTMAGVKLTVSADRTGLRFASGQAIPTDPLSPGRFFAPGNPEPEPLRSRHGWSAAQMRKQMRAGTAAVVPPTGPVGYRPPGLRADPSRSRDPEPCVTLCHRDCQSPVPSDEKRGLTREAASATAAKK